MSTHKLNFNGKPLNVDLTDAAHRALASRTSPLLAEMELYFSCLIRLKVRFHENGSAQNSVAVDDKLRVRFRPVMTASCGTNYEGTEPPLTDFPIAKPESFIPHWLRIDYRHGQWQGEFGYT